MKVLIVAVIIVVLLLGGGGIWLKKRVNSPSNSPPKPNNNSQKELASEIKNRITTELEQIKKAKTTNDIDEILVFGYKVGPQGAILQSNNRKKVLPSELEATDYQEIVKLITQKKRELAQNKTLELRKEIAEKLNDRPDLFYWPIQISKTPKMSDWYAWSFFAKEKGKDYKLIIPRGHPATLINVFKDCQFYQINGVENIPLTPSEGKRPYKIVKLEDHIEIKLEN